MSENGIGKFLTSAKTVIGIIAFIVVLTVWFVVMYEDVADNTKQIEVNSPKAQDNRERILVIQADIKHIKGAVDDIFEKVK